MNKILKFLFFVIICIVFNNIFNNIFKSCIKKENYISGIPKKLFFTVPTLPVKKVYHKNIDLIKKNTPEWEVVVYDDEMIDKFININYPEYMEYYKKN